MDKPRKQLSEEALKKLALARELANKKRKELAQQRAAEKEKLVQEELSQPKEPDPKLIKQVQKEAARRRCKAPDVPVTDETEEDEIQPEVPPKHKKKKPTVVVEYSSSSSDDIDFEEARVMFVKKERVKASPVPVRPQPPAPDPMDRLYRQMFG